MKAGGLQAKLGGPGKVVMVDETYHGKVEDPASARVDGAPFRKKRLGGRGGVNKHPIITLVESGGQARTFHVADASLANVQKLVRENVNAESRLHTDASPLYTGLGKEFAEHESVRHSIVRELFQRVQARHAWRVSALPRKAPAPLSVRIRFSPQHAYEARR
jgi:hypothetical protein